MGCCYANAGMLAKASDTQRTMHVQVQPIKSASAGASQAKDERLMAQLPLSEEQCQQVLDAAALYPSKAAASNALCMNRSTFQNRLNEARRRANGNVARVTTHEARIAAHIENGCLIVFSDAHYLPGEVSTAHKALVQAIKEFRPRGIIANGDVFDGSSISRFPRIGWDHQPTVKEEIDAVTERFTEIEQAAKGYAWMAWNLGNHDARYETYLAAHAPQYQHMGGFSLKDHFPLWKPAWRCDVNPGEESHTIVKHRWKGGIYATRNNAINAGVHIVTSHLHSPKVAPVTNARGTFYGVDTGCLADPDSDAFVNYTEDNVKDWRSGFALLTYRNGRLLFPELVSVVSEKGGIVEFRGKEYTV